MCGVTGVIDLRGAPVPMRALQLMTEAIAHRGPDGEGHWIKDNVGIGHRRLSIIDPSDAGRQPMFDKQGRYVLAYNGELYNYMELKKELEHIGHNFVSQTDTEVFLTALVQWGTKALFRFNGMFAFALWDQKEQKLLLARDRYGVKPLYYAIQGNTFSFGSEQKAITAYPGFSKTLDKAALLQYFTFQNIFTNQTLIEDIKLLPAGHFGLLDVSSGSWMTEQYWDYHFSQPKHAVDEREYTEELSRLMDQAVSRQLISDVELGSYLSGGIDSGSISALASKKLSNLKTFTIGFDLKSASGPELDYDERKPAMAVSRALNTDHREMILGAADMERSLPALVHHLEEPRLGQSYPNYYAAKLASEHVKVVLSGTGGDELFGGYPWRYFQTASSKNFEHYVDEYYLYWQRLVSNSELRNLFSPVWEEVKDVWTRDIFSEVFSRHENELDSPEDFVNHSLYFEAKTFLHGLFVVEDKLSMAHGLETRVPFMDNDLVEFAMACPVGMKLDLGVGPGRLDENDLSKKAETLSPQAKNGKLILRRSSEKLLPKAIFEAKKQGFSAPDASWFREESSNFVKKKTDSLAEKNNSIFCRPSIKNLTSEHLLGNRNRRLLIWSFLSVENYLENTVLSERGSANK